MRELCIIPARGGSKGIPNKNIMDFCGKPLIAWSIEQALDAGIPGVLVSTDHEKIASVSHRYGASARMRPSALSGDNVRVELALMDVLKPFREDPPDVVVMLQCTSPVREPAWLRGALDAFGDHDSMFSAYPLFPFVWEHDLSGANYDPKNRPMRQEHNPKLVETGSFYLFRPELLFDTGSRIGGKIGAYIVDNMIEIDEPEDVPEAEWWMRHKQLT